MTRPHPLARLQRVERRTPLRIKLVLVVVSLAATGLALAAIATTESLHSYLIQRVDKQLEMVAGGRLGNDQFHHFDPGSGGSGPGSPFGQGASGTSGATGTTAPTSRPALPSEFYVVALNPNGTVDGAARQAPLTSQSPPKLPRITSATAAKYEHPFTVSSTNGHASWRAVARMSPGGSGTVVVATPLSDTTHTIGRVMVLETAIGLVALVVIGLAGYLLVIRSLRPLVAVEGTAAAIAGGDLSRRVPELPERTEVGQLSKALNGMLAQIENAFAHERLSQQRARESEQRMRQFVADASHELRTPLTSIRGFAELYRMGAVDDRDELPRLMRRIEDEAARMGMLVEDLLLLARLDQQRPLASVPVDVLTVVSDVVHDAQVVAPDRSVTLTADTPAPPIVTGDEARLRQVVTNLVGNALTHTPSGTPVGVRLATNQHHVVIEVSDRGPGVDAGSARRIFERFYRADSSRSREGGGSGLGLSIVAGLVAAHGGSVDVTGRDGGGAVFTVTLPLLVSATV